MPADRLAPNSSTNATRAVDESVVAHNTERAVLAVLTGTPLAGAALAEEVDLADLAEATEVYQRAGQHALEQQIASGWWQLYVQFTDWHDAERAVADHLAPLIHSAEDEGVITAWWFMRKHPCWRLRLQPGPAGHTMKHRFGTALDELTANGRIAGWRPGIYEAETPAFGGQAGMDLAHELFCADSRAAVNLIRDGGVGLGRRELSLLLCTTLMRAAGLEWYEQGDVWHRVAQERRLPADVPVSKVTAMASDLKQLMLADVSSDGPLLGPNGPLASAAEWADSFRQAGRNLGAAARRGTMQRGLREVVSYLVIFHWNRLGLPARTQSILAWAACAAILDAPAGPRTPLAGPAQQVTPTAAAEAAADMAMRRFPLVLQGRRRCADLETRVGEVRQFADTCQNPAEPEDRIDRACSVWNLAALVAADCGMSDLAVELCNRQLRIFQTAWPVSGRTAIASLQPLVNLARLTSRAGDPDGAYRALRAIDQAARHGGNATIHGTTVPFDEFIATDGDRSKLDPWLQVLLREDGTRALAAAGKWTEAAEHAEQHDEAEELLRESRQTRVIAYVSSGRIDDALRLIDTSVMTEPREFALAACLRSYAHLKGGCLSIDDLVAMLAAVRLARKPSDGSTTLFRIRLGLTALDLCVEAQQVDVDLLCTELIEDAERSTDAYAAREVLNHPICRARMTGDQAETLKGLMGRSWLDAGSIPKSLLSALMVSVETAGTVLVQTLDAPTPYCATRAFSRS